MLACGEALDGQGLVELVRDDDRDRIEIRTGEHGFDTLEDAGDAPLFRGSFGSAGRGVGYGSHRSSSLAETLRVIAQHAAGSDDSYFDGHGMRGWGKDYWLDLSNAASKATVLRGKSRSLTKAQLSVAPWKRSMRPSSHSIESGPL